MLTDRLGTPVPAHRALPVTQEGARRCAAAMAAGAWRSMTRLVVRLPVRLAVRFASLRPARAGAIATALAASLALLGLLAPATAIAAPPPANSVIGNQATATYTDASGASRTSWSNLVQTTVQAVYGHDLSNDNAVAVAPGGNAVFAHTLTNLGNATDTYTLSTAATGGGYSFGSIAIYPDVNADGVPDGNTPITSTGALPAGQSFHFVVVATVPATATSGQASGIRVGAVGAGGTDPNNYSASTTAPTGTQKGNTDTATVSSNAVIVVTKSYSLQTGPVNQNNVTVTLTYTNTGNVAASGLVLTDFIGLAGSAGTPAAAYDTRQMTYVAGQVKWNGGACSSGCAVVEPAGTTGQIVATIAAVNPGQSGTLTYVVNMVAVTTGAEKTVGVATYAYDPDGSGPATTTTPLATNVVKYLVSISGSAGVTLGDSSASGATPSLSSTQNNAAGGTAGSLADANGVTVPSGASDNGVAIDSPRQGATLLYQLILSNTGSIVDTFDLGFSNSGNFPAGTAMSFVNAAGAVLGDTNGDGLPDTGPVGPGAAVSVFVRVNLPPNALATGPLSRLVRATSAANATTYDETAVVVTGVIVGRKVDLDDQTAGAAAGTGAFVGLSPAAATLTGAPGNKVAFKLRITADAANSGPDNYDIRVGGAPYGHNAGAADTLPALPSGWVVSIKSLGGSGCPAAGATLANTGNMAPGVSCTFELGLTVPTTQAPGNIDFSVQVLSPSTGVDDASGEASIDALTERITVVSVEGITLTPNNARQVFPGGAVHIPHRLCNNSNVPLTAAGVTITVTHGGGALWNSLIYVDQNGNQLADANEAQYSPTVNGALAAGACVDLVVKVFAPAAAVPGSVDGISYAASATTGTTPLTAAANDVVEVASGTVVAIKEQTTVSCTAGALPSTGWVQTPLPAQAPGNCVAYRTTVTNTGATDALTLTIIDQVPTFTTLSTAACGRAATAGTLGGTATDGTTGSVTDTLARLAPQAAEVLSYCVRIDH